MFGVFGNKCFEHLDRFLLLLVAPEKLSFQKHCRPPGVLSVIFLTDCLILGPGAGFSEGSGCLFLVDLFQPFYNDVTHEAKNYENPKNDELLLVGIKKGFEG